MEDSSGQKPPKIGEWLLDFIFPRFCIGCQLESTFLCQACEQKIIKIKIPTCLKCKRITKEGICPRCKKNIPITKSIILGYHKDPILKELIHNLKYEGLYPISSILSKMLIDRLNHYNFPKNCAIVPVPLNKWRFRSRGFNQSALIAQDLARYFGWQFMPNLLERTKNTKPQIHLKPKDRFTNIQGAFRVSMPIPAGTIILLDDVVTTGATIKECAKTLRAAGAVRIWLIAVAHG